MANRATSTRRAAASTTKSGQAVTIFTEDGFSVAGSVITPTTAVALSIVEPGATSEQSTVSRPAAPVISSYSVSGVDDLALDPAGGQTVIINGTGFKPGVTVFLDSGYIAVVNYISVNQISFTTPAKSAGSYTIYVTNTDGGTGILTPGLIYSSLPAFVTDAGSLGSYYETQSIDEVISATADSSISYSLYSGSLPSGATLNSAGYITGTAPVDGSSTTYTFTIKATDQELQDSTRSFSLTINTDVVTWSTPTSGQTITSFVNSPISNVTLSAASSANANDSITYTANTLPGGLSLSGNTISGTANTVESVTTLLTATASTTTRSATRIIYWSILVANDTYLPYVTTLLSANNQLTTTSAINDGSSNNVTLTPSGNVIPTNFNPYQEGYYSCYFDGSGDYITATLSESLGTSDFTVEAWVWFASDASSTAGIVSTATSTADGFSLSKDRLWVGQTSGTNGGSQDITTNTWVHVALTRSGSTLKGFLNGTQAFSTTTTKNLTTTAINVGSRLGNGSGGFKGHISNVRVVKGTAVYTSAFTPPTEPLTAISGTLFLTCQSPYFREKSSNALTLTAGGDVRVVGLIPFSLPSQYSTYGSVYFDGSGDYIGATIPAIGTGDFTVEAWVWFDPSTGANSGIIGGGSVGGSYNGAQLSLDYFWLGSSAGTTYASNVPKSRWVHCALSRSGSTLKGFLNGVEIISATNSGDLTGTVLRIGSRYADDTAYLTKGYISDVRVVKGTAVYTSAFTPPSSPLTAISGTCLLTLQKNGHWKNYVIDKVGMTSSNVSITPTGNATSGSFSPYGDNWSSYFDGTGDYLTVTGTTAIGTSNFTVEYWIMFESTTERGHFQISSSSTGFANGYTEGPAVWYNTNTWYWARNSGAYSTYQQNIDLNTWYHVALSRNSETTKLFINGTEVGSVADNSNYTGTKLGIGGFWSTSYLHKGFISNFRLVIGNALYTSNFTPSTTPLTAVANTNVLACQSNRFIDKSNNALTITVAGDAKVQKRSPFNPSSDFSASSNGGSMYFDGTGDYINLPSSVTTSLNGTYTIEAWCYLTSQPGGTTYSTALPLLCQNNGLTSLWHIWSLSTSGLLLLSRDGNTYETLTSSISWPSNGQWFHVAITNVGTLVKLYINGNSAGSLTQTAGTWSTTAANAQVGAAGSFISFPGYISDFRIINGVELYTTSFTPPTAPLSITSETKTLLNGNESAVFDSSGNLVCETVGDARVVNRSPYGSTGTSYYFDGTGDWLDFKDSKVLNSFYKDFTIEFWLNYSAISGSVKDFLGTSNNTGYDGSNLGGWVVGLSSTSKIRFGAQYNNAWSFDTTFDTTISTTWTHIALVRSGSTIKCYINGVAESTTGTSSAAVISTYELRVGAERRGTVSALLTGYISDLRITNGVARYTSNFSVPTEPYKTK